MKVIFLDIDGVLSPNQEIENKVGHFPFDTQFSSQAVSNLKSLLTQTGAKLVLSTRWINTIGFQATVLVLASHGITGPYVVPKDLGEKEEINSRDWLNKEANGKFYGVTITPKKFTSEKGHEISMWLSEYANKIDGYVVLDDDSIFFQEDYQVQTNDTIGLTKENVEQAILILNQGMKKYKIALKKRMSKK